MMEKKMEPNIIDYYIINCAIRDTIDNHNRKSSKFIQGPITTTYKGPFTTNNLLSKEPNRFLMIAA